MPRDITTATKNAAAATEGHAFAYLAELYFDSAVTSSRIDWQTRPAGASRSLIVEVSVDGGRNWRVADRGGTIPGLEAGTTSHGKRLVYRTFFSRLSSVTPGDEPRPIEVAVLDWIEVEIDYDTGETFMRREETQADFSTGTLRGTEATTEDTLRVASEHAIEFTGADGYVEIDGGLDSVINLSRGQGTNLNTNQGPIIIEFAGDGIRASETGAPIQGFLDTARDRTFSFEIVFRADNPTATQTLMRWGAYTTNMRGCHLYVEGGRVKFDIVSAFVSGQGVYELEAISNIVETPPILEGLGSQWVRVAVIYDGLVATIWVNEQVRARRRIVVGRLQGAEYLVALMSGNLRLGQDLDGSKQFTGAISELRLWRKALTHGDIVSRANRELSDAEVTALVNTPVDAKGAPGLLVWYSRVSDGNGSLITDAAYGNDGRLVQPAAHETGVMWTTTPSTDGTLTSDGVNIVPYRQAPMVDLAVYGNRINVATTPFSIEYGDATYLGVGRLGSISEIDETADLESRGIKVALSGVQLAHISLALQAPYRDRPARIMMAIFGDDGLLKGDPVVLFEGLMDTMPIQIGQEATVGVTLESHLARWDEARPRRWTATSQRELHPEDAGFDLVVATAEKTIWWPAKFIRATKDTAP